MDASKKSKSAKKRQKKAARRAVTREEPTTATSTNPSSRLTASDAPSTETMSMGSLEATLSPSSRSAERACAANMVARPDFGNIGRQIQVYANVFPMQFRELTVYQYDVDIQPIAGPQRGGGRGRGRGRARGGRGRGRSAPAQPPGPIKRDIAERVWAELIKSGNILPPGAAFDGQKNLYVPRQKVDGFQSQASIKLDDKQKAFQITVSFAAPWPLSSVTGYLARGDIEYPAASLAALDVALHQFFYMQQGLVSLGNAIFRRDNRSRNISPGVEAWAGYYQSARPCQLGLCLNMNSCFTPMIQEQTVLEYIEAYVEQKVARRKIPREQLHQHLTDQHYKRIAEKLDKLKAKTVHNRRREIHEKLAHFSDKTAATMMFKNQKGKTVSVAQYMQEENGYRVRYPNLRLMMIYKKNKPSHHAFPPECLKIKTVPYKRKMMGKELERLIQAASQKPAEKKAFIEACHKNQLREARNKTHLDAWGVQIAEEMAQIPARVLPGPNLEGGDQTFIDVKSKGEWDVNAYKFQTPVAVHSWGLANFSTCRQDIVQKFMKDLLEMLQKRGMEVAGSPYEMQFDRKDRFQARDFLRQVAEGAENEFGAPCQIIMVILPEFTDMEGNNRVTTEDLYTEIKLASDQLVGIPSQCIRTTNAGMEGNAQDHNRRAYVANLTLKINAKLGGVNSILYNLQGQHPTCSFPLLGDKPFMVLGADLTHPSPGSNEARSVVGVVASMDRTLSHYACRTQFQECSPDTGREVIRDLKRTVKELLKAYFIKNRGVKPEAILFYRDGVSQGEFPKVVEHEYKAIRDACAEMGDPAAEYSPPISFIIVSKRHGMRFFAKNPADTEDSGNVCPGLVVDSHVCHPHGFDFYLVSHTGIQGTSRPTLYSVLRDEVGFNPNDLQLLTYWMCHLFCRCTRSVSYCPPAYYAHHAATRGKLLWENKSRTTEHAVHPHVEDTLYFV